MHDYKTSVMLEWQVTKAHLKIENRVLDEIMFDCFFFFFFFYFFSTIELMFLFLIHLLVQ